MFFIGLLFSLEAIPILLLILLIVLIIKFYGHIQHFVLSVPWWGPLLPTVSLIALLILLSLIVPKKSSLQELLLAPLAWGAIHSLWFSFGEYICARDALLFTVVGLPSAIGAALYVIAVIVSNGMEYISEKKKVRRNKRNLQYS